LDLGNLDAFSWQSGIFGDADGEGRIGRVSPGWEEL